MAVHIAFEKSSDSLLKKIVRTFAGPYVHTEIIVSQLLPNPIHTSYSAYVGNKFSRTFQRDLVFSDQTHDFLNIDVSEEELYLISKTCEACVNCKIPYNTSDMVLSILPFRSPSEPTIATCSSLFCSQAVVLILRSCLKNEHPLLPNLMGVNSRTVTPSQLYTHLQPTCRPAGVKKVLVAAEENHGKDVHGMQKDR